MIMAKSKFIKILLILLVGLFATLAIIALNRDLSPDRSSALFGGKLENGYNFAGYAISFKDSKVTTCGVVYLSSTIAITAAHCVIDGAEMFVGTDQFKLDKSKNIKVKSFIVNDLWNGLPYNDIAVLNLESPVNLNTFANISTPERSCNYEIVGYGQNESSISGDFSTKQRKSIEICIESTVDNLAYIKGSSGGICYGDSGSPVFEKSTNKFVGIVSSIISNSKDISGYCAINNSAAVVLPAKYTDFVASVNGNSISVSATKSVCGNSCNINSDCANGLSCNNNKCVNQNNSCIAQSNNYCAIGLGLSCEIGNSCVGNVCISVAEISEKAANSVLDGIMPILILIGSVILIILALLIIPFKKRN